MWTLSGCVNLERNQERHRTLVQVVYLDMPVGTPVSVSRLGETKKLISGVYAMPGGSKKIVKGVCVNWRGLHILENG